jgi:tetratricopeptide (TPR) repeat protein
VINVLLRQGKHAAAEKTIREAINEFDQLIAAHPARPDYQQFRADFQRELARIKALANHPEEAEKSYLEAISSYEKVIAQFPQYEDLWRAYDGLAHALTAMSRFDQADEARRKVVELAPSDAGALNSLAWQFATSADPRARNASLAVELAKRAVELDPKNSTVLNTLGIAYYRAGNWEDAIELLTKSMEGRSGGDSFNWFFLAMAHWQLGNKDAARDWHVKAIEWMDDHAPKNEELLRLRAEAAELLGISGQSPVAPAQAPQKVDR